MAKYTLNIGCGDKVYNEYPVGFKCINFDERSLDCVDEVGNAKDLSRYSNEYFSYILASDIIEHFPLSDTHAVLKEWMRVLVPGGTIEFRLPNLAAICTHYLRTMNAKYVSWLLYGSQSYSGNFHYIAFDREWFKSICSDVGLQVVSYGEEGFNMRVITKKGVKK